MYLNKYLKETEECFDVLIKSPRITKKHGGCYCCNVYKNMDNSGSRIFIGNLYIKDFQVIGDEYIGAKTEYEIIRQISNYLSIIMRLGNITKKEQVEENQIQSIKNTNKLLNIRLNEIEKKMEEVQKQYMTILEAKTVKFQFPSFDRLPSFDQTLYSKRSDFLKSKYQNHGKDWTKGEEQALRSNYVELIKTISAMMGRSPRSIQEKIRHMGLNSEHIEP